MAGETSRYYKRLKATNPTKYRNTRLKQQKRYNKKGSSKPGTKNITGNEISKKANRANRALGTYGNGDGKDAAHTSPNRAKLSSPTENRTLPRKGKRYSSGVGRKIK
tara:strand:+ start:38 stop:358 length:321 start_codon:yes stop_codon:yes gene_type:complete